MTPAEIAKVLRCTATVQTGDEPCASCPFCQVEMLTEAQKAQLHCEEWRSCDVDGVALAAADLIERLETQSEYKGVFISAEDAMIACDFNTLLIVVDVNRPGYVESAASGLLCGLSLGRDLRGLGTVELPSITAMGAMGRYVSTPNRDFQPMNCTFGLLDGLLVDKQHKKIRNKQERYTVISERSLSYLRDWVTEMQV